MTRVKICLIFRGILRRQVTTPHSVYIDFKLGKGSCKKFFLVAGPLKKELFCGFPNLDPVLVSNQKYPKNV